MQVFWDNSFIKWLEIMYLISSKWQEHWQELRFQTGHILEITLINYKDRLKLPKICENLLCLT